MIYLVQSYYNDKQNHPRKCLKIGYAKDIEERMKAYKTYNPSIQLLKTREGEYDLESFLHKYFDKYKLPDFNEWFIYKKEIIDKFDVLEIQEDTITREEYLEYIRKEILTSIIPEIYKDLKSQIPDLLDELKQEFKDNYNDIYSSLYTEFPENECKEIIIKILKFLREIEIHYFSDCDFSTDILDKFPEKVLKQRLKENVFRDECIFIYKLSDEKITLEEYKNLSARKLEKSQRDLKNFEILVQSGEAFPQDVLKDIRLRVRVQRYGEDYTGINEQTGQPVVNKLVMISERRAFELRSNVYKNEVQVYNEFADLSLVLSVEDYLEKTNLLMELKKTYRSKGNFETKMKSVCDLLLNPKWYGKIHISDLYWLPLNYRNYLNYLGPERIKALGYFEAELKRDIFCSKSGDKLKDAFINEFLINSKYTLKFLKEKIKLIYCELGLSKTPKASDLLEYFNVKEVFIYDPITKKQSKGYLILSLKE